MTQTTDTQALTKAIDQVLPQTQCGDCSYGGCMPYAKAIAENGERINRCPPGGVTTLKALAELTGQSAEPYIEQLERETRAPQIASIREDECIGCTKCIQACPVDAIIGSGKLMHTILLDECTGCGLCVDPCPVDCIDLHDIESFTFDKDKSRQRFHARIERLDRLQKEKADKHAKAVTIAQGADQDKERQAKRDYIKAAMERAKAKKAAQAKRDNND